MGRRLGQRLTDERDLCFERVNVALHVVQVGFDPGVVTGADEKADAKAERAENEDEEGVY